MPEWISHEEHWHMPAKFLPPLSFTGLFYCEPDGRLWEVTGADIVDNAPDVKVKVYFQRPLEDEIWRAEHKAGSSNWFDWSGREPERVDSPLWPRPTTTDS